MIFGVWCEKCQGKLQLLYGVHLYSSSRYFITFQGDSGNLDNKNLNFLCIVSADNTVKNEAMA
jgi:hypothetical protein